MSFLNNYKTYIVAGLTLALLVLHWFNIDIPGMDYTHIPEIGVIVAAFFARQESKKDVAKLVSDNDLVSPHK